MAVLCGYVICSFSSTPILTHFHSIILFISAVYIMFHSYKNMKERGFSLLLLAGTNTEKLSQPRQCCCCSEGQRQQSRSDSDVLYLPAAE